MLFTLGASAVQGSSESPRVVIVSTSFLLPGKIHWLQSLAKPLGINIRSHAVDTEPSEARRAITGAALVILDTPRGNDRARVMESLQETLQSGPTPWIAVGGGRPLSGGLDEATARSLSAYYAAGGEDNFRHLMQFIDAWQRGKATAAVPAPKPLPAQGIYHPAAAEYFASWAEYQAWGQGAKDGEGKARWPADAPVFAIAMSDSGISNGETAVYDLLIGKLEAAGAAPLVFWSDRRRENALLELVAPARPAALLNTTHMVGEALKEELWQLNIPLLTGLNYRDGDSDAWRASSQGLPASSAATLMVIPETWGMSDPMTLSAVENGSPKPLPEQVQLLVEGFMARARLRDTAAADKRVAVMFWNSPAGEKNLSASNLNVPRSIENILSAFAAKGYTVEAQSESTIIDTAQQLLSAYYRPEQLDVLLEKQLARTLPVKRYRQWLQQQPASVATDLQAAWGDPARHWSVRDIEGEAHFVIPMARLGNVLYLPQPPRADRLGESTHDLLEPPGHFYLATYLFLRQEFAAHAFIHLGTHGTQEWTPGKDRGLWAFDYPNLAVGPIPVFYPYIQDNIGEAMQAKRRGRAVTISHQTPPFAPSGFYDELLDIHDLMHQYLQLEDGALRESTLQSMLEQVKHFALHKDMGWTDEQIAQTPAVFVPELHDHLHRLAQTSTPIGLHSFGQAADERYRFATVMQQLGEDYYRALGSDIQELFGDSFETLFDSEPYRYLLPYLSGEKQPQEAQSAELRALMQRAVESNASLLDTREIEALLAGLDGELVMPGGGGDPVRNPDTTSGTNLYAIDPEKIPSPQAYAAAEHSYAQLVQDYRDNHDGEWPDKLAFSLWSSETIRTLGLTEAQIMHALGVRPVWDRGGRVTGLEIIPADELQRPRVDTVIQVTSVYRDQFDGIMKRLARVIETLSEREEPGNPLASNTQKITAALREKGLSAGLASQYASARLFSNPPGSYGSGVTDVAMNSTQWEDEAIVADTFINSQSHIYSHRDWGTPVQALGLLESQLEGVDAVLMSRSSNLHGLLSTDHPFEYLGGLSAAVKSVSGENPALYVGDNRGAIPAITAASAFMGNELRTRYQNPQWIEGMKAEGYAGTVSILKVVNNLFGWQVMDTNMVREDQWQAMHETYVMDQRELGLNAWFEEHNATAQAQLIERMAEAIRKGYWDAPEATRRELIERWDTLVNELGAMQGDEKTVEFIEDQAAGFGMMLNAGSAPQQASNASAGETQTVRGQVLQAVEPLPQERPDQSMLRLAWALLALSFIGGAIRRQTCIHNHRPETQ
nr:cobaltochelatase subunit CobN [Parahaliea mediterranea]